MPIFLLDHEIAFPSPTLSNPDGILAVGGDLSLKRLILAYQMGIFPWYSQEEPIIWWSPDPRFVIFPDQLKVSKSMKQVLRRKIFDVSFDTDFRGVITACQQNRIESEEGTWITDDMREAYCKLHRAGVAHSVEVRQNGELVGGLYGISLGKCFFGESMFTKVSNASKAGFITLAQKLFDAGFYLIDCQQETPHLGSLGAKTIDRDVFLAFLAKNREEENGWQLL